MKPLRLWCSCGGSIVASSSPPAAAVSALAAFRTIHHGEHDGCITDDPKLGAKYLRAARRRENAAIQTELWS